MRTMLKWMTALALCLCLLVSFAACSSDEGATEAPTVGDMPTDAPIDLPTSAPEDEKEEVAERLPRASIDIDGAASTVGHLNFSVSFSAVEGSFDLFFADAGGHKLADGALVARDVAADKKTSFDVYMPLEAHWLLIEGENASFRAEIPADYRFDGADAFVFGAISDVHYNRYERVEGIDDADVSFPRALDFFAGKGVDFVAIAGDLSESAELNAFERYNDVIDNYSFPVYTVTGNHDIGAVNNGKWKEMINTGIVTDEDVVNIAENGLDFVYAPEELGGDVFIFLSQVRADYNKKTSTILNKEQLDWLEAQLEQYKNVSVYLFFHTFLCGPDGEKHTGVGNIINPGGYTYPLAFTYDTEEEQRFRGLMKTYKNVFQFSGHSHWMFDMEIYGEWANFSNYDGEYAYFVHVPSVTEPRYIGENDADRTGMNGLESEGWLIYDYGDVLVFLPVDFMSGTYYTEYIEIVYTK